MTDWEMRAAWLTAMTRRPGTRGRSTRWMRVWSWLFRRHPRVHWWAIMVVHPSLMLVRYRRWQIERAF